MKIATCITALTLVLALQTGCGKNEPSAAETYPQFASSTLARAHLMPLPEGVLLIAPPVQIMREDLDRAIATAPVSMRSESFSSAPS